MIKVLFYTILRNNSYDTKIMNQKFSGVLFTHKYMLLCIKDVIINFGYNCLTFKRSRFRLYSLLSVIIIIHLVVVSLTG